MKERLIQLVKDSKLIYNCYYHLMNVVVKGLKLFVKPDDKLILFVSYGGRYFNDSPKCLYDKMLIDERFAGYKLVWAFRTPSQFPEVPNRIKIDSIQYFVTALKARCWVTNVHIERGLDFKGKNTYYFNTAHTNIPKLSEGGVSGKKTFKSNAGIKCDYFCVQSAFEEELFKTSAKTVKAVGFPKNDILADYTPDYRSNLRKELGVSDEQIVILYAPTFREGYLKDRDAQVDFKKWETILGNKYLVWFRAHPVFACKVKVDEKSTFIKDMSNYSNNNDLMIAADVLISDYSGIFTEFGIQQKPMFCYAYDYDDYVITRGLYFDVREDLPGGYMNEDELLEYIKNGDRTEIMKKVDVFRSKYIQVYGHATDTCLHIIYNNIK